MRPLIQPTTAAALPRFAPCTALHGAGGSESYQDQLAERSSGRHGTTGTATKVRVQEIERRLSRRSHPDVADEEEGEDEDDSSASGDDDDEEEGSEQEEEDEEDDGGSSSEDGDSSSGGRGSSSGSADDLRGGSDDAGGRPVEPSSSSEASEGEGGSPTAEEAASQALPEIVRRVRSVSDPNHGGNESLLARPRSSEDAALDNDNSIGDVSSRQQRIRNRVSALRQSMSKGRNPGEDWAYFEGTPRAAEVMSSPDSPPCDAPPRRGSFKMKRGARATTGAPPRRGEKWLATGTAPIANCAPGRDNSDILIDSAADGRRWPSVRPAATGGPLARGRSLDEGGVARGQRGRQRRSTFVRRLLTGHKPEQQPSAAMSRRKKRALLPRPVPPSGAVLGSSASAVAFLQSPGQNEAGASNVAVPARSSQAVGAGTSRTRRSPGQGRRPLRRTAGGTGGAAATGALLQPSSAPAGRAPDSEAAAVAAPSPGLSKVPSDLLKAAEAERNWWEQSSRYCATSGGILPNDAVPVPPVEHFDAAAEEALLVRVAQLHGSKRECMKAALEADARRAGSRRHPARRPRSHIWRSFMARTFICGARRDRREEEEDDERQRAIYAARASGSLITKLPPLLQCPYCHGMLKIPVKLLPAGAGADKLLPEPKLNTAGAGPCHHLVCLECAVDMPVSACPGCQAPLPDDVELAELGIPEDLSDALDREQQQLCARR